MYIYICKTSLVNQLALVLSANWASNLALVCITRSGISTVENSAVNRATPGRHRAGPYYNVIILNT